VCGRDNGSLGGPCSLGAALESMSQTARTTEAHSITAWLILAMSNVPGRRASDGACLYDEV